MQSLYTVYFNDGANVTPLFYIEGYTAADERFVDTARAFVRRFFPGSPETQEVPFIIKKYEEPATFTAAVYADYNFKKGIVFAKKMHEAVVYEKIHYPGRIRDSYEVKCVGRIGVLCQTQEMPEQDRSYIDSLKIQIDQRDKIISQQENMIKRLEADVTRLERSSAPESPAFVKNPLYDFSPIPVPPPPTPVPVPYQFKVNNFARKGQVTGDVLKELEEVTSLTPSERKERRDRERQERERRKRKEEKRREREREEKKRVQEEENSHVLDLLIKEITEFGVGYTGGC